MAFRAIKADTYSNIRSRVTQLKTLATNSRIMMAAGNVSASSIRQLLDLFISGKSELQSASAISGIVEYAQSQEGDAAYNVSAEFTAMINACTNVINWIITNVPVSGGYVQLEQWSSSGVNVRVFTPLQTANLRTALQNFENTVV